MARPKSNADRVTFAVPRELLELADLQAEKMHLERYDVIRIAIGQGLLLMRMQNELVTDFDVYRDELVALVSGDKSAARAIQRKMEPRLVEGVESQVRRKKAS